MDKKEVSSPFKNEAKVIPNTAAMKKIADSFDKARQQSMKKRLKSSIVDFVEVK